MVRYDVPGQRRSPPVPGLFVLVGLLLLRQTTFDLFQVEVDLGIGVGECFDHARCRVVDIGWC